MFDWDDLRYFLAVAREGSTIAAAKALGVSQPTVQRRLAAFEKLIGRSLVEPHPTGYRLTDIGKELLPHAERIEEDVAAFERQLAASDKNVTGTVRITCPEADVRLLAAVFDRFRARHPGLRLELLVSDRLLDLSKGDADVALRGGDPGDSILIGRKLADCPWYLYASRSYVEQHGKPQRPDEIAQHPLIAYTGPIAEQRPARWLRSVASDATIAAYSNNILGALSAVRSGAGLGLLPAHIGSHESEIVCVFKPQPELTEPFTLLVHPDLRNTLRVRAVLDFFSSEAGAIRSLFRGDARET
jgi:DNA-binding transcriptional LysR family regulator